MVLQLPEVESDLKDLFAEEFHIGAALCSSQVHGRDSLLSIIIKKHFNTSVIIASYTPYVY